MRHSLRILIPVGLAVAAALFLATLPGLMSFEIGAIAIEAPVWLAGLAIILVLVLIVFAMRLIARARVALARRGVTREMSRREDGNDAIVSAFAALAAGDGAGALREVGRARKRMGETPLTLLVEGHAERALRNEDAAKRAFDALAKVGPPGAFLGYRGLAALALEQGDRDDATAAGRAALEMRPEAPWAKALVFDAAARKGDWQGALAQLRNARKGTEEGKRRAALLLGVAGEEENQKAALRMVEEAVELAPGLAPAHAARVKLLTARDERRRATAALERGIAEAAHPMLAEIALTPLPGEDKEARATRVEALASRANGAGEAELMAAEATKDAGLWAKARRHVGLAREGGIDDKRAFMLLAEIASAERGTTEAGRAEAAMHLREAAAALPEPVWWCGQCGTRSEAWVPVCPHCGAVASLAWGTVAHVSGGGQTPLLSAPMPGI